jgi:hypothetical protein
MSVSERTGETTAANVNFYVNMTLYTYTIPSNIIYYYDQEPPTDPTQTAYSAPGTYVVQQGLTDSVSWEDIPPGTHVFAAQVVTVDNKPYDPPVVTKVAIDIPTSGPELRLISINLELPFPEYVGQTAPQTVPPILVQFVCADHNFKLSDDNIGKANVGGEGHYIYYMDTAPPTKAGKSAVPAQGKYKVTTESFYVWELVPSGTHEFSLQLVNNDNTPLNPPVSTTVTVTVPAVL